MLLTAYLLTTFLVWFGYCSGMERLTWSGVAEAWVDVFLWPRMLGEILFKQKPPSTLPESNENQEDKI